MEKIITTIVSLLFSKISKEKPYYTQKDLSEYGFPQFLIKRITYHLIQELSKEFTLPGKEWIGSGSDDLISEWAELQRFIKREIQLPANLAEEIIEKSVRDCVGMTIHPRKVIPELLFEGTDELDSNQLTERSSAITVNRFLVWSMVRYMEKKGRDSLNIIDAKRIINSIDDKIVENYNPINWLSLVKPLYELSGSTVHSDLFRLFFEHKGKNPIAKEFDLINGEIKESKFVEILSSPNSLYVAGYVDDQQTLFREEVAEEPIEELHDEVVFNEDLTDVEDSVVEDSDEQVPIHLAFSEDQEDDLADAEPEPFMENTDEVLDSEKVKKVEEEEPHEELVAPWDEDEEGTATLLDSYKEDDDLTSEFENSDDENQDEIIKAESELPQKDQQISDAVLLEFEDEEALDSEEEAEKNENDVQIQADAPELSDSDRNDLEPIAKELVDEVEEDDEVEDEALFSKFTSEHDEDLDLEQSEAEKVTDAILSDQADVDEDDEIEEEALFSKFKSDQEEDLDLEESNDKEESVFLTHREATILEVESESVEDEEEDHNEGEASLLNRFMFDDSDLEDPANIDKSDSQEKVKTIYDELNLVRSDAAPKTMDLFGSTDPVKSSDSLPEINQDQQTESAIEDSGIIQKFSEIDEDDDEKGTDESDVPMWKSFLERDEEEVKSSFQFDVEEEVINVVDEDDSDELLDEDGFIEEPIYDLTKKEPDLNEKIGDLSNWMQDVREKFIEELFGDSEDAYEQALSDIVEIDDWKNASRYIEKEIFTRNRIDVYDEIAVDFTDRLHSYFIENKS